MFAIAAGLRLARFNAMIDDPSRPEWKKNFFVGMPAPAGAITALLPIYLQFLGVPMRTTPGPALSFLYLLLIALSDGEHDPDLFRQDDRQARAP